MEQNGELMQEEKMSTISGCIMARNEEKLISGCICSLKPFVDEIIVIDNGSTDQTRKIAESYGCVVYSSPDSDVDKGRELYLRYAKMEWILILDADERLDTAKVKMLKDALDNASPSVWQFRIPWFHYIGEGKFVETSTAARIVRNVKGIKYNNFSIHASLTDSIKEMGGRSEKLHFPLYHFDVICGRRTVAKREKYRSKLLHTIEDYKINRKNYGVLENIYVQYLFLGVEYTAIGDYATANKYYDIVIESKDSICEMAKLYKAFSLYESGEYKLSYDLAQDMFYRNSFREKVYYIIMEIEMKNGKFEKALKISNDVLMSYPQVAHVQLNHGILLENTEPESALKCFWNAINLNPCILDEFVYSKPVYPNIYSFQCPITSSFTNIYHHLAQSMRKLERFEEAQYWEYKEHEKKNLSPANKCQ